MINVANVITRVKNMKYKDIIKICFINLTIFIFVNLFFNIKYEQVDDFIIYNLYSGLDGTYNFHGVYVHVIICEILSMFFRIIPSVNWHSIFLLVMQYICFTTIGVIIINKHNNRTNFLLYTLFASVFYTVLLFLIQYTSVSALLILTSLFILMHIIEQKINSVRYKVLCYVLYAIGIMIRFQSLLIIIPFYIVYALYYLKTFKEKKILKYILVLTFITASVYLSDYFIYNSDKTYKEYMEYNSIRATLHDLSYTDYDENKEIFDEIGWSRNDHYLFYTFNFGDENKYSKENLQKIVDYKIQNGSKYNLNLEIKNILKNFINDMSGFYIIISAALYILFLLSIYDKEKRKLNLVIFVTTIGIHILFIILKRAIFRVIVPEYILGGILLIYNTKLEIRKPKILFLLLIPILIVISNQYNLGYDLKGYTQYRELISYTNSHKENVYLYTVPSLQDRYLSYPVYEMPPKNAFSNLRVIGRMGYVHTKLP